MPSVQYDGDSIEVNDNDSLLDQLLDAGYDIPHACKAGVCHSCMMQALSGKIPADSQEGLPDDKIDNDFFLSCQCHPIDDMSVQLPGNRESLSATVESILPVSADVLLLRLKAGKQLDYKPGQFVNLIRDDGLTRSYSLASVPGLDDTLDFHIKVLKGGKFSEWAEEELFDGDPLDLQGPFGDCYYNVRSDEQPMLLAATGTGLAPLYGIIRAALDEGHTGDIRLYMGARNAKGLYFVKKLQKLAENNANFSYLPVLKEQGDKDPEGTIHGDLIDTIDQAYEDLSQYSIYLCGAPSMVNDLVKLSERKQAHHEDIHHDAFVPTN